MPYIDLDPEFRLRAFAWDDDDDGAMRREDDDEEEDDEEEDESDESDGGDDSSYGGDDDDDSSPSRVSSVDRDSWESPSWDDDSSDRYGRPYVEDAYDEQNDDRGISEVNPWEEARRVSGRKETPWWQREQDDADEPRQRGVSRRLSAWDEARGVEPDDDAAVADVAGTIGGAARRAAPLTDAMPTAASERAVEQTVRQVASQPSPTPRQDAVTVAMQDLRPELRAELFNRQQENPNWAQALVEEAASLASRASYMDDARLQKAIIADWSRESGRAMPNPNDPRDMENFRNYAESWMGVARDFTDPASKGLDKGQLRELHNVRGAILERAAINLGTGDARSPEARRLLGKMSAVVDRATPPMPPTSPPQAGQPRRPAPANLGTESDLPPIPGRGNVERIEGEAAGNALPPQMSTRGAVERPDSEAPPYVVNGDVMPNPVTRQRELGDQANVPTPMVAGTFSRQANQPVPDTLGAESDLAPNQGPRLDSLSQGPLPGELAPSISGTQGPGRDTYAREASSLLAQAARQADQPLTAATSALLAQQRGQAMPAELDDRAARIVGAAIATREPWAEAALDNVARMAFSREYGQSPDQAPDSYVQSWKDAYRGGDASIPLASELNAQMREQGVLTPDSPLQANWKERYGTAGLVGVDQSRLITDEGYRKAMDTPVSYADAVAICGPVAAQALARAARADGGEPTLGEAFEMAKAVGWTQGGGMNGFANQVRLMDRMQVPYEASQRVNVQQVAQAVSESRPAILSTEGHYFVATDYDPQSGKFFVGATGRAYAGGSDWMTPQQMERISGKLNGQILLRADVVTPDASPPRVAPASPGGGAFESIRAPLASTNLFSGDQSVRRDAAERFYAMPSQERRAVFEQAMDEGLAREGITDQKTRDYWKDAMRRVVTGEGEGRGYHGENPDMNPYIMAYERQGRIGTATENARRSGLSDAQRSSALGYFQFLKQRPDGKPYGHERFMPEDYRPGDEYNPVMQVRQFIRAVRTGQSKGDPMAVVAQKRRQGSWNP